MQTVTVGNPPQTLVVTHLLSVQELHHLGGSIQKREIFPDLSDSEAGDMFIPQTSEERYTPIGILTGVLMDNEGLEIIRQARDEMQNGMIAAHGIGMGLGISDLYMSLEQIDPDGMTMADPRLGKKIEINENGAVRVQIEEIGDRNIYQELNESSPNSPLFRTPERSGRVGSSPEGTGKMAK